MKRFIISEKEEGMTLLKYSIKMLPLSGQGMIRKFLRNKNIELNGKKSDGSDSLRTGDEVSFFLSDETFLKFHGQERTGKNARPLEKDRIIYEDDDFLIYDKEAGILSQSDISGEISVNDMLLSYAGNTGTFTPSICNRLDRNTSGIILAGLSAKGTAALDDAIRDRRLLKYYLCICEGIFEKEGTAGLFLKKDEARNVALISDRRESGYDPVETHFRIIKAGEGFSLLEAELITGKPHQIRATLSYLGHPIVGDLKYGAKKGLAKRQLLHAYKVVFPKDILNGKEFIADCPEDMHEFSTRHNLLS
ncbi:MAG: RluA family pseudouridine synthase [Lachnospiraceae bacterium]|nr:RluA family pseudouridine synthase [Lachnospiraceae bacterium]